VSQSASLVLLAVLCIAMAAPQVEGQSQENQKANCAWSWLDLFGAFDDLDWDYFSPHLA